MPGIGVLWFALRGEWRALFVVATTTSTLVGLSLVIAPAAWIDWVRLLVANTAPASPYALSVPFVIRLPLAIAVMGLAARTDRPWLVPVAAVLAMPVVWQAHFTILTASLALWLRGRADRSSLVPSSDHGDMTPVGLSTGSTSG